MSQDSDYTAPPAASASPADIAAWELRRTSYAAARAAWVVASIRRGLSPWDHLDERERIAMAEAVAVELVARP